MLDHGLVKAIVLVRQVSGHIADRTDWDCTLDAQFHKAASDLARRIGHLAGSARKRRR